MKRYTIEVVIDEGNDEFWESITGSGCDEITSAVKDCLDSIGLSEGYGTTVKLISFIDKE